MTVKFTSVVLALLLVLPVMCETLYLHEIIVVDIASDSGASLAYVNGKPEHSTDHPFISFSHRHRLLLLTSAISLTLAVGVAVSAVFPNMRGARTP